MPNTKAPSRAEILSRYLRAKSERTDPKVKAGPRSKSPKHEPGPPPVVTLGHTEDLSRMEIRRRAGEADSAQIQHRLSVERSQGVRRDLSGVGKAVSGKRKKPGSRY